MASAESLDSGKPLKLAANVDVPRAVANLKFFAAHAQHQVKE
jgi:aminomuconate-semialdehyde/2-hydroxymuconate-6-semialdehyde dehydrogenase